MSNGLAITNNSRALQGVWSVGGLVLIEPGETRAVVIDKAHIERTKALPFLTVEDADPLDHDGNGRKGGSKRGRKAEE